MCRRERGDARRGELCADGSLRVVASRGSRSRRVVAGHAQRASSPDADARRKRPESNSDAVLMSVADRSRSRVVPHDDASAARDAAARETNDRGVVSLQLEAPRHECPRSARYRSDECESRAHTLDSPEGFGAISDAECLAAESMSIRLRLARRTATSRGCSSEPSSTVRVVEAR